MVLLAFSSVGGMMNRSGVCGCNNVDPNSLTELITNNTKRTEIETSLKVIIIV